MSKVRRRVGGAAALILTIAAGPALAQETLPDPLGLRRGPLIVATGVSRRTFA